MKETYQKSRNPVPNEIIAVEKASVSLPG